MQIDSACKKCRRAQEKLFLKGDRCSSQKCAMVKKPYIPGIHGQGRTGRGRRKSFSEYGQQLAEKQKLRWIYGVSEKQFKNYVKEFIGKKNASKEDLVLKLEMRLDNVVFRLGLAKSRRLARQLVSHGHIIVNKRKVNIPSYRVKKGDLIKIRVQSKKIIPFQGLSDILKKHPIPAWLQLDKEKLEAKVIAGPKPEDVGKTAEISKIIEFYSR